MNKFLIFGVLSSCLGCLTLAPGIVFAGQGAMPDFPVKLWRSSETGAGQLFNSPFSSGPVVIHSIIVDSPTVNIDTSYCRVMGTTSPVYDAGFASTKTAVATNSSAVFFQFPGAEILADVISSSWTYLDKRGGAFCRIKWDWLDSILANPTGSLP